MPDDFHGRPLGICLPPLLDYFHRNSDKAGYNLSTETSAAWYDHSCIVPQGQIFTIDFMVDNHPTKYSLKEPSFCQFVRSLMTPQVSPTSFQQRPKLLRQGWERIGKLLERRSDLEAAAIWTRGSSLTPRPVVFICRSQNSVQSSEASSLFVAPGITL